MTKTLISILMVISTSHSLAATQSQTDWSGGSTVNIATDWDKQFQSNMGTAWRGKAGQISLTTQLTNKAEQTIIAGDAQRPYDIAPGDLTGNGYDEVLTAHPIISSTDIKRGAIYLWQLKQTDNSWYRRAVTEDFYGVNSIDVFDFDKDGDLDILASASYGLYDPLDAAFPHENGRFAWFENSNGDGSSWVKHEVGSGFYGANNVSAADIDGDGDNDLMSTSYLTHLTSSSDVTWFENTDGKGSSWVTHAVDNLVDARPYDSEIVDIDGDGDIDFLVAHWSEILIYENTQGDGSEFVKRVLTNQIYSNPSISIGDMDNDNDIDVVLSAPRDPNVFWLENVAGDASEWQAQSIFYLDNVHNQQVVDADGDGDLDIIVSYFQTSDKRFGRSFIFENTSGDGKAWAYYLVQEFLDYSTFSKVGDMNNDGRLDIVVMQEDADRNNIDQLSWYDVGEFVANGSMDSQIIDGGSSANWDAFSWKANVPDSTLLDVFVRSGNDTNNLGLFTALPDTGADVSAFIDSSARYFQYKLEMSSSNVNQSPVLTEIGFNLVNDSPTTPPTTPPPVITNEVPVADAGGAYTYFPKQTATLTGQASYDVDGQIIAYQWNQISGKQVSLTGEDQIVASFITPRVKRGKTISLVFELTVTDNDGATDTDTVTINVRR